MVKKASLADIAREARVGTATAERVLNARGMVRPETAEKVILAARKLGYDRRLPDRYHGIIRVEVIMVLPESGFFKRLNHAFARIAASLESSILVHRTFVDQDDPKSLARYIANPDFRRSGLIIVGPDHPEVRESLLKLKSAGVPFVSVVSRICDEDGTFVGIDNYAAGRAAAFYMTGLQRQRRGTFVALSHSGAFEVHRQRIRGFSDYLGEHPHAAHDFGFVVLGGDDYRLTAAALRHALDAVPNVIGLYNAGGANRAVAEVLERQRGANREIMWIGHELTENSRAWLKSGLMHLVLDQAPETQARRALDWVLSRLGFIDLEVNIDPVPFVTFNSENC